MIFKFHGRPSNEIAQDARPLASRFLEQAGVDGERSFDRLEDVEQGDAFGRSGEDESPARASRRRNQACPGEPLEHLGQMVLGHGQDMADVLHAKRLIRRAGHQDCRVKGQVGCFADVDDAAHGSPESSI
jgi:hypothetical protein